MKRWNGWGEEGAALPLAPSAATLLQQRVGEGAPRADATLDGVVRGVGASRLASHPLLDPDPAVRLRHARGQSLPDWIALRSGSVGVVPDAVAFPQTREDVRELLTLASATGARVIPYGGGTSVVGHLTPDAGPPVITLSLARLRSLVAFDARSGLATFGAGINGPELESELRGRGFTLGHFPQSFEHSTLGGWVVTRSSGQQSLGYGRIERLFAGGNVEMPSGRLEIAALPASAAGPDLREMVLGSEGRLGVLTHATVRAVPLAEREEFHACAFATWEAGTAAARRIAQERVPLSMIRLSDPEETATALAMSGHGGLLGTWLRLRGLGPRPCLMLVGATGRRALVDAALTAARDICCDGVWLGAGPGRSWKATRFRAPYLRNTLWDLGYAVDTLETATSWAGLDTLRVGIQAAIRDAGERVHVFTHLSHVYVDGASLYTTYVFPRREPDALLAAWRAMKTAASDAIARGKATISHHHGVGRDHRAHFVAEKGAAGLGLLAGVARVADPHGVMNPGALLP